MSPDQIQLVRDSFARLGADQVAVGESVYRYIFVALPAARALFRGDIGVHATNLMGAIALVVSKLDRLDTVVPAIQALGRRHAGYGVTGRHLDLGGAALLRALADHAGPLTPEAEAAWSQAYTILSRVMLDAAARDRDETASHASLAVD